MLDYTVSILAGIAQMVVAWLGYRVSARPIPAEDTKRQKKYETIFVIAGLIGAATIIYSGISLSLTLEVIRKAVTRPTENQHAHVDFLNPATPGLQPGAPTIPLREGENLVNISFMNSGRVIAQDCRHAAAIYIVSKPTNEETLFDDFLQKNPLLGCDDLAPPNDGMRPYSSQTYKTQFLSPAEVTDINEGHTKQICAVARATWKDESGRYQKDFCECWSGPYAAQTRWGSCSTHNTETKLP